MAAPERFAERSNSSCTAGTVHTWPVTSLAVMQQFSRDRVESRHRADRSKTTHNKTCPAALVELENRNRYNQHVAELAEVTLSRRIYTDV